MHALTGVSLPAYDDRTEAVQLYSETRVTVGAGGKLKRLERKAYRILRPNGAKRGMLVFWSAEGRRRVTDLHAWCIPASGKDHAVKQRDGLVAGMSGVPNGIRASDIRVTALQIPAAEPGNIIGHELEADETPEAPIDVWTVQDTIPVRSALLTAVAGRLELQGDMAESRRGKSA